VYESEPLSKLVRLSGEKRARGVEHLEGAGHVRADELAGGVDRAIDMRLGCEVVDHRRPDLAQDLSDVITIADVALGEAVARVVGDDGQVVEVARVGQPIEDDDLGLGLCLQQVVNEVRTDETAPPVTR
jgi:hypothetical protein